MNKSPPAPIERALTICEPYAWLVSSGVKIIENRTWRPPADLPLPHRIAVHAGTSQRYIDPYKGDGLDTAEFLMGLHPEIANVISDKEDGGKYEESDYQEGRRQLFTLGAIIGSVEIIGCVDFDPTTQDPDDVFLPSRLPGLFPEIPPGMFAEGPHCWLLASAHRYRQPIYCPGRLNLWKLSPAQQAAVAAAEADGLANGFSVFDELLATPESEWPKPPKGKQAKAVKAPAKPPAKAKAGKA